MKKSEWAEYLDGFYIVDCAIKSKQIAYVLAVQDEPPEEDEDGHIDDEEWRLISWGPEVLGGDQSVICERHYNFRPVPALAVEGEPYNRLMLTDTNGNASLGDYGKDDVPAMEKMKTLWEKLYIMNGGYVYWRNSENNTWERIDLPESLQEDNRASSGPRKYLLIDFDAFTPQDFYLLDNEGIVLYQEAGIWNETNLRDLGYRELDTYGICCGPDGWVYIFGKDEKGGKIFQGKGDRWKVIWEDNFEIFHIDMVAYQDYVLISNNIMFSKIQNGKVEHFKSPCTGSFLSVRDNLLMVASSSEAAIYDGNEWKMIISPHFNEAGEYAPPSLSFNQDEVALMDQMDSILSDEGEEELAATKKVIDSMDEATKADLQKKMYEAVQDHKNKLKG